MEEQITIEEFEIRLKALLALAVRSGHTVDEIGELTELVLQGDWE